MDRIPELYFSFLGILKIGAIVQPLFSAFGDESLLCQTGKCTDQAIITQKKHLPQGSQDTGQIAVLESNHHVDPVTKNGPESKGDRPLISKRSLPG